MSSTFLGSICYQRGWFCLESVGSAEQIKEQILCEWFCYSDFVYRNWVTISLTCTCITKAFSTTSGDKYLYMYKSSEAF